MKIIERKIQGKLDNDRCEDGIAATDYFIAVADGGTSKTNLKINPLITNGKLCMMLVCQFVKNMSKDIAMENFCQGVSDVITSEYIKSSVDINRLFETPTDRITASVVVYSDLRREIWMVGDCQCMVDGILYENPKPYEKEIAKNRATILRKAIENGESIENLRKDDIGRKSILSRLKAVCKGQNVIYPVVDGFPIPTSKVKVIHISEGNHEIVLASDGYPGLKPTLKESEEALKTLLEKDPLCIRQNVATKGLAIGQQSFDDRAYVRFTVE